MADLRANTLTFLVEEDLVVGKPVYHLFPSHQPHDPHTRCGCGPVLKHIEEADPGIFIEIWWHWRDTHARL